MQFDKTVFENRLKRKYPFLASHRGVNCSNVPCNTLLSYKIAMDQGADVVEIDVDKSADGQYFCFHPGTESIFLKNGKRIGEMTAKEIESTPLLNLDEVPTHYRVPRLEDAFALMKGKVYINVDKFWTDVGGISEVIRACGVEKQVIVKTPAEERYFAQVEEFAPDLMYMSVVWHRDGVSDIMSKRNVNYIGAEVLWDDAKDQVATREYVDAMHKKGLLVWANSIVYNEKEVISAGLTDDAALESGDGFAWIKLAQTGYDFIQTDWILSAKEALNKRFVG